MSVFLWVLLNLFSQECNEVLSGVFGFDMALGCPSFNVQDYLPVAGEFVWCVLHWNSWLLGGAWSQCRYGDFG